MAMGYKPNLTPAQISAGSKIYGGFYGYAIGKGADAATANQFANIGLGVSSGEGWLRSNPWAANPDGAGTSVGPFQLYSGGVGADYGISAGSSPDRQIYAAADTMWGGNSDYYNTQPWNAVGDSLGGNHALNDSAAGQNLAESIGSQYSTQYGWSGDSAGNPQASWGSDAWQDWQQDQQLGQGSNPADYGLSGNTPGVGAGATSGDAYGGGTPGYGTDGTATTPGSDLAAQDAQQDAEQDAEIEAQQQYATPNEEATAQTQAANQAAGSGKAGSQGQAASVAQAIVTGLNQIAKTQESTAKAENKTDASNAQATNATNKAIENQKQTFWGGWFSRIFVFIVGAILLAVGLWLFKGAAAVEALTPAPVRAVARGARKVF